jgi:hypothetical protein
MSTRFDFSPVKTPESPMRPAGENFGDVMKTAMESKVAPQVLKN